jgi:hypothetical protein
MDSSTRAPEAPLAAGGGLPPTNSGTRDPYEELDDLMVVVEALCPTWPLRPITGPGIFKL